MQLGVRLLTFACSRGWPQTANLLISGLLHIGLDLPTIDAAVTGLKGSGLLHTALQAQSPGLVWLLHAWGERCDHCWDLGAEGPHGVTPMHLAAVLPKRSAQAAVELLSIFPRAPRLWFSLQVGGAGQHGGGGEQGTAGQGQGNRAWRLSCGCGYHRSWAGRAAGCGWAQGTG